MIKLFKFKNQQCLTTKSDWKKMMSVDHPSIEQSVVTTLKANTSNIKFPLPWRSQFRICTHYHGIESLVFSKWVKSWVLTWCFQYLAAYCWQIKPILSNQLGQNLHICFDSSFLWFTYAMISNPKKYIFVEITEKMNQCICVSEVVRYGKYISQFQRYIQMFIFPSRSWQVM